MSRHGGFRFPEATMSPLHGLKRGPVMPPDGEPGSKRPLNNTTTTTQISMFPQQQLVPTVRRSDISEQQRQSYVPIPANNFDGEDSGDDDFHDAQEDPDYDFFNGNSANTHQNAEPSQQQEHESFELPPAFQGRPNHIGVPQQQPQQVSGPANVMDLTGDADDEENEDVKLEDDQNYDEWDEFAIPDGDFGDIGIHEYQYQEEEVERPSQGLQRRVNAGFSFDYEQKHNQQGPVNGSYAQDEQAQQYQEDEVDGNYASDDQLRAMGFLDSSENPLHDPSAAPSITNSPAPAHDEGGDLFGDTFGEVKDEDPDSDIEMVDSASFNAALKAKGFSLDPSHGLKPGRIPTPPLPSTKPSPTSDTKPSRPKRAVEKDIYGNPYDGRIKAGPCVFRDRSKELNAHFRFHSKVYDLVPRIPNWEDLDWNRRYWIAVLLEGKKPKNANSERDFVWMKGNKYSTVRTVMEKFVQTTLGDHGNALVMGYEKVNPGDKMEELDYFDDRLCVFRVLGPTHPDAKGKSLVEGVIPPIPEVIELDDD